jgi:hypothetical protein
MLGLSSAIFWQHQKGANSIFAASGGAMNVAHEKNLIEMVRYSKTTISTSQATISMASLIL